MGSKMLGKGRKKDVFNHDSPAFLSSLTDKVRSVASVTKRVVMFVNVDNYSGV